MDILRFATKLFIYIYQFCERVTDTNISLIYIYINYSKKFGNLSLIDYFSFLLVIIDAWLIPSVRIFNSL